MKISVRGFKSIKTLDYFDFKPISILAGVNSSGKTSLTQSLLLLKQTLESDSKALLKLEGPYLSASSLQDLIYGQKKNQLLGFTLVFKPEEISNLDGFNSFFIINGEKLTTFEFSIDFQLNDKIHINSMEVILIGDKNTKYNVIINRIKKGENKDLYKVETNNKKLLGIHTNDNIKLSVCSLNFTNFFPIYAENTQEERHNVLSIMIMKLAQECFISYFRNITYIGPIRVKPEVFESFTSTPTEDVGIDGKYTRFVLHAQRDRLVNDRGEKLFEQVKYWICERMGLAKDLNVKKEANNTYRITLKNLNSIEIDLCHVGFGVSQILPIIVQGLLTPQKGLFIVDAPEVHMHPSIQSEMVDFFIELSKQGKHVLVETHSEHLITRVRRCLAEKKLSPDEVNLCFVENIGNGSEYTSLQIDETGTFYNALPNGFLNTQDEDFKAIIKAKYKEK